MIYGIEQQRQLRAGIGRPHGGKERKRSGETLRGIGHRRERQSEDHRTTGRASGSLLEIQQQGRFAEELHDQLPQAVQ